MTTVQEGFSLTKLLQSGAYSDFTLACQGQEFKVHKAVVCSQSPVLAAAAGGSFKEAQTGIIRVEEFEAETMRHMIEFLYNGDYNNQSTPQAEDATNDDASAGTMSQHVKVNAISDFYQIKALTELSNKKILHLCETAWDPQAFVVATKEALGITGDSALHDMLALFASEHFSELSDIRGFDELGHKFDNAVLRCRVETLETDAEEQRLLLQDVQAQLANEIEKRRAAEAREQAFKSRMLAKKGIMTNW